VQLLPAARYEGAKLSEQLFAYALQLGSLTRVFALNRIFRQTHFDASKQKIPQGDLLSLIDHVAHSILGLCGGHTPQIKMHVSLRVQL
jgi:hypothetical protein